MKYLRNVLKNEIPYNTLVELCHYEETIGMIYVDCCEKYLLSICDDILNKEVKEINKNCQFICNGGIVDVYKLYI